MGVGSLAYKSNQGPPKIMKDKGFGDLQIRLFIVKTSCRFGGPRESLVPAYDARSHSWGTSFSHFVSSIRCHAMSKEGEVWMDASYWICSFEPWMKT